MCVIRDSEGSSRVLDVGNHPPPPTAQPPVPTLLRMAPPGKFVRDPKSTYTMHYTHQAVGGV